MSASKLTWSPASLSDRLVTSYVSGITATENVQSSSCISATVNETIQKLAEGMLFYPEYISLSSD